MKDPWQTYLQLGVVHNMAFPECLGGEGPQWETLREICHDDFFEAVDIRPINDPAVRKECSALLRDCAMNVTLGCQPVLLGGQLDLNSADAAQRKKAIAAVVEALEQAPELGASRFAVMSGKNVPPDERRAGVDRLIDSLRQICKAAKERAGIPVVLEIFDYDMDKKALVGTCAIAAEVAEAVRRDFPDFGLLHDLSHIYLCHEDPAKHLPIIKEYLVAIHMGSSVSDKKHPMFGDTHPLFGMPGGDNFAAQLRDWIRTLFDIGYLRAGRRPVCGFEIKPPPGVSPQTAIANMKRTWHMAWWTL
ncbi:MAG: sugar phosphate isomerase/epimerase [Gemmataceae bacterium]|nr:sugar phosphate isomerase/epimerase [Gemmataceae bacterium]